MLDIGWSEMAVIAVVALVVIGPKDLPKVLRSVGQWTNKARGLAREFQSHLDDLARQADVEDMRKQVEKAASVDIDKEIREAVDPKGELAEQVKIPEVPINLDALDPPSPALAAATVAEVKSDAPASAEAVPAAPPVMPAVAAGSHAVVPQAEPAKPASGT
jgi:sec-independent protein translocase protein TatB